MHLACMVDNYAKVNVDCPLQKPWLLLFLCEIVLITVYTELASCASYGETFF